MFKLSSYVIVILGIATTVFTSNTTAAPMYHLLTETDPGQITNNLVLSRFDTLSDLINLDPAGTDSLPGLAGAVSAAGLAFDGSQYLLLTETDPGQITNNLVLSRFDTLSDLINLDPAGTNSLPGLAGAVSAAGLAFDGSQYLLLTETDPGQITNNLVLSRFDTLSDLINLDPTGTDSLPGLAGAVSAAGLAFDGNQYLLLTETDPGQMTNNLVLSRFDTLSDLINLDPAGTNSLPGLAGAVSVRGLTYTFEPVSTVPEPAALVLLTIGLAGLGVAVRRRNA